MKIANLEFHNFNNQYLFFENFQKNNLIKIRNDLRDYFESIEQKIFLSSWRKNKGYISDGFKSRTILTIYGNITYKRRVYKYLKQKKYKYVFLADKKLHIKKYSRVSDHLKLKILEQIATGKRQRDICDTISQANITTATIGNIIKSFNFQALFKDICQNITKIKIPKYLYFNMDETYIRLRKTNKIYKYRIRLVTFHTGYNEFYSTDKRKVLDNKRVYYQLVPASKKINTDKFMSSLKRFVSKFYSNIDDIQVIICGDGAPWIRKAKNYWPNSKYILDKFHALRYLNQIFSNKNNETELQNYQKSKNFFELGAYNDLITQLKQIRAKPGKAKKLKQIINYFINNDFGIRNQKLEYNIGVSAEGDISHIIKWLLGYGSKAFNHQTFKNMLFLKTAEMNKLNVINFLKQNIY